MGIITKINNLTNYIEVKFDDDRYVTYDSKQAEELELAYAVTIINLKVANIRQL